MTQNANTIDSRMSTKLNSVQVLRAYAAISVLIGHALLEVYSNVGREVDFNDFPLLAGVDVFFVISGFIMYHTSANAFNAPNASSNFLIRRFIRIAPLYWIFTTAMVASLLLIGQNVRSTEFELWNVISSYLFIPSERAGGRIAPILSVGWTLNYEMFFYAIFAATLFFKRKTALLLLVVTFVALPVYGAIFEPTNVLLKFWTNTIILEFLMGILIGLVFAKLRERENALLAVLLIVAGLIWLYSGFLGDGPRFIKGGIPASLMLIGALILPRALDVKIPSFLLLLGDASFALYLCHRFVLRPLSIIFGKIELTQNLEIILYVTLASVISIIASIFVFKLIEQPLLSISKRYILKRPKHTVGVTS